MESIPQSTFVCQTRRLYLEWKGNQMEKLNRNVVCFKQIQPEFLLSMNFYSN